MLPQKKSGSPKFSALVTLGLVILAGAFALVGISVFMRGFSASAPAPTFVAGAAPTQPSPTETSIPPTEPGDATPTPIVIMGVPNLVTPPPTYAVGPTAQFTKVIPVSEWLTYEDKQAGFSVKYPPDWYLKTTPEDERVAGYGTSLFSYDSHDMKLSVLNKSGKWPSNFVKMEIMLFTTKGTNHPLRPNQTIEDWVRWAYPDSEDERIVSEAIKELNGVKAFERITYSDKAASAWRRWRAIYLFRGEYIMVIGHAYPEQETVSKKILETIVSSIRLTK